MNALALPVAFVGRSNWHVIALVNWDKIIFYALRGLAVLIIWTALGGLLALWFFSGKDRDDD